MVQTQLNKVIWLMHGQTDAADNCHTSNPCCHCGMCFFGWSATENSGGAIRRWTSGSFIHLWYKVRNRVRVLRLHKDTLMHKMDIKFLTSPFQFNFLWIYYIIYKVVYFCVCVCVCVLGLSAKILPLSHYIIRKLHKFNVLNDNLHAHTIVSITQWYAIGFRPFL